MNIEPSRARKRRTRAASALHTSRSGLVLLLFVVAALLAYADVDADQDDERRQPGKARIWRGADPDSAGDWVHTMMFQGTLEGEFRWMRHREAEPEPGNPLSSLYVRRIELAATGTLTDWADAFMVLNSEYVGDLLLQGDENIVVDEGHLDFQKQAFPVYFVLGKRTQPFGLFDNHLITDPMTQDAYEIKRVGATLGYTGPMDLDLSVTGYTGEIQVDHFLSSGLVDETAVQRAGGQPADQGALILASLLSPLKEITLFGSYLNEPGIGRRNQTADVGFTFASLPFGVIVDAEYIWALARENYRATDTEFKESVLSASIAYVQQMKAQRTRGGANFRARRSRLRTRPVEVVFRYEYFDDGSIFREFETWSAQSRYSLGGKYTLYRQRDNVLYGLAEYRHTALRIPAALHSGMKKENQEIYLRLGISF